MSQHCTGTQRWQRHVVCIGFLCYFKSATVSHRTSTVLWDPQREMNLQIFLIHLFEPRITYFFVNREKFRTLRSTKPFKSSCIIWYFLKRLILQREEVWMENIVLISIVILPLSCILTLLLTLHWWKQHQHGVMTGVKTTHTQCQMPRQSRLMNVCCLSASCTREDTVTVGSI